MSSIQEVYCIDKINLFSVLCILRNTKISDKIIILPGTESFFQNLYLWFLKKCGKECIKQSFHGSFAKNQHSLYQVKIFDFMKDYVEPELKKIFKQYPWSCQGEFDTFARCAAISEARLYHQIFCLILLKKKFRNNNFKLICYSKVNTIAFKKFASDQGLKTITYRFSPFYYLKARKGYFCDDEGMGYIKKFSRLFLIRNILRRISQAAVIFLKSKYFSSSNVPQKVDVIALLHQDKPHDGLNEVYWQDTATGSELSVMGITARQRDEKILNFYKNLKAIININKLLSIYPSYWLIESCHKSFVEVFGSYIKKLFWVIKSVVKYQMDFQTGHIIVDLEFKSSLYEWLLKTHDAKIFWTVIEDDNTDAIGMSVASKRANKLSLGTSWSLSTGKKDIVFSDAKTSVFLSWGEFQRLNRVRCCALHKKYIDVGYQAINTFQKSKLTKKNELKTICFFDSVYGSDTFCHFEIFQEFIDVMQRWISKNSNFNLIIKAKKKGDAAKYLGLRCQVNDTQADFSDGLNAEVVIGYDCVTPANICAAYGKKVILFDYYNLVPRSIAELPNVSIIKDMKDFEKTLEAMLTLNLGEYTPSKTVIDAYGDYNASERTAFVLSYVIKKFEKGFDATEILNEIDEIEHDLDFKLTNSKKIDCFSN